MKLKKYMIIGVISVVVIVSLILGVIFMDNKKEISQKILYNKRVVN